ncbi:hypothetical protein AGR6A_pTi0102 [Agrobacterium sp. NCPPB 925]|nr:hypothetical protein AGR6A_pTi0102 [Agrobacterium sp. NCPPB 925]
MGVLWFEQNNSFLWTYPPHGNVPYNLDIPDNLYYLSW